MIIDYFYSVKMEALALAIVVKKRKINFINFIVIIMYIIAIIIKKDYWLIEFFVMTH